MLNFWSKKPPGVLPVQSLRPYLNLGCGDKFHADWTNVDIAPHDPRVLTHDLRLPLPFEDESFEAVYHSHVLEHIPRAEARRFIGECWRVLVPGGVLRVVVPDLETIARLYLDLLDGAEKDDSVAAERYEWIVLELLDQLVRHRSGGEMLKYWQKEPMPAADFVTQRVGGEFRYWRENWLKQGAPVIEDNGRHEPSDLEVGRFRRSGEVHRWMYDRYSIRRLLEAAGFEQVRVCGATESAIPDFASFQLDSEPDGAVRKPDSLFVEGRKSQQGF